MSQVQEMRMVKPTSQSVAEAIELVAMSVVMFYLIRPDKLEQHLSILKRKRDKLNYWLSVQNTLATIRSLPETRNGSNT